MKKIFFLIILSVFTLIINGQQVFLEIGKNNSSFDYHNSDGKTLDNLNGSSHVFMQMGYHTASKVQRMNYSLGLSYNGYGARGSDETTGNYFDWDVNYLGLDLGIDYEFYKKRFAYNSMSDLAVYVKASVTPELLVSGTQTINSKVFNLVGEEQFKYPLIFVRGGCGVSYTITRVLTVYFEYMGGKGFPLKFGDSDDAEKLRINGHNFSVGLLVDLPSY
jgi:hypothetical protein